MKLITKILALIMFLALIVWGLWAIVQRIMPIAPTLITPNISIETIPTSTTTPLIIPCDISGDCHGKG